MEYVLTQAAVQKLRRLVGGKLGDVARPANKPASVSYDDYAAPFTVRWSASENSGSGAWVIWLPNPSEMLIYGSSSVTITGVTAATELPSGWYTIDALSSSSNSVYIVITVDVAQGAATAELSDSAGQASTGETITNIIVATMATDSTTGAKSVKQFVDSTVSLGVGAGVTPDDRSVEFIPDAPSGTTPDGDEGQLQIKGWKTANPQDSTTLATYLQNGSYIPSTGLFLVACKPQVTRKPLLVYIPLGQLFQTSGTDMTVEFVADMDWFINGSTHQLRKRFRVLNLRTGQITDKAGTTYAQGWEVAANTTPISNII